MHLHISTMTTPLANELQYLPICSIQEIISFDTVKTDHYAETFPVFQSATIIGNLQVCIIIWQSDMYNQK